MWMRQGPHYSYENQTLQLINFSFDVYSSFGWKRYHNLWLWILAIFALSKSLKLKVWTQCQVLLVNFSVWKSEFSTLRYESEMQSSFCPIKGKNYAGACSQVVRPIAQVFHDISRRRKKRRYWKLLFVFARSAALGEVSKCQTLTWSKQKKPSAFQTH